MSHKEHTSFQDRGRNPDDLAPSPARPYAGSRISFSIPRRPSQPLSSPSSGLSRSSGPSPSLSSSPVSNISLRDQEHTNNEEKEKDSSASPVSESSLPYRPLYLHRRILFSFLFIFLALVACIEVLRYHSSTHFGLATAKWTDAAHYLCRLAGPGALLLLVAAWSRVEFQAKMAAPWLNLASSETEKHDARKTVLLDYLGGYGGAAPVVAVRAMRNRDWLVALVSLVGVLLKVGVSMSAGFVKLRVMRVVDNNAEMSIGSVFRDEIGGENATIGSNAAALAFYTMVGVQQAGVAFPDGMEERWAYQRFEAVGAQRDATITAVVDGFTAGLECEVAQMRLRGLRYTKGTAVLETSFAVPGCNVSMPVSGKEFLEAGAVRSTKAIAFVRLGKGSCGSSTAVDQQRLVMSFGMGSIDLKSLPTNRSAENVPIGGSLSNSAQLLCKPTYSIRRLRVTKRGTVVQGTIPTEQRNRTLNQAEGWSIAQAILFSSLDNEIVDSYSDKTPWFYGNESLNADPAMYLALDRRFRSPAGAPSSVSLLQPSFLREFANDYFRQSATIVASRSLMQETTNLVTNGTVSMMSERVFISDLCTHLIAILLGVSALLTALAIFMVPKKGFLPHNPATIIDITAIVADSGGLLQSLRGTGDADIKTLHKRLAGVKFHTCIDTAQDTPFAIVGGPAAPQSPRVLSPQFAEETQKRPYPAFLHPLHRLVALAVVVGLVIALDLSLQAAFQRIGLGSAGDDPATHFLWTVIPTLVLGSLTLYFASASFISRLLAPYAALFLPDGGSFEQTLGLRLVDMATPGLLFAAIKYRNLTVVTTAMTAFVASLLTFLSAALFSSTMAPIMASVQLVSQDTLVQRGTETVEMQNGIIAASLILNGNASYPAWTHEDLVFPSLSIVGAPQDREPPPGTTVLATLPALRPWMVCRTVSESEITVNLTVSSTPDGKTSPLRVGIVGSAADISVTGEKQPNLNGTFFGAGAYKPIIVANNKVSRWVWIWGQLEDNTTNTETTPLKFISGLTCNETFHQLNVTTHFIVNSTLDIDPANPPLPDEGTIKQTSLPLNSDLDYKSLIPARPPSPQLLDPFFASLTTSRFAIPLSHLGNQSFIQLVSEAIIIQHKLVRAQIISASYPTITIPSPPRILQDIIITRIMQALLALIFTLTCISWLTFRSNILPRSPSSIASVAAFLADGNVLSLLPPHRHQNHPDNKTAGELHLRDRRFRLEWGTNVRRQRRGSGTTTTHVVGSPGERMTFGIRASKTTTAAAAASAAAATSNGESHRSTRRFVRDWGWRA
ncbi:hypothetical protein QBC42DRAFT_235470 [Cladorrhinum samala]|uniref:Uncharacterized protein n=1 Tax=Cladorrhinum samala TaxID=585594 RepID=A0AAV9HEC6_9PEZI|nr:hypothetical protein QBC42DRAFT_235470 [Cladorrhinum samala]